MIIEAEALVRTYAMGTQVIRALDGISLEIDEGDMIAVRGPSGSGKSTLMNILGCLERPDSGRYTLAGEDVSRLSTDRLAEIRNTKIGFVFQVFNLLPRMTALENVALPMQYAGRRDSKRRAIAALETVGLAERVHHRPSQLSGGERQRVAIARSIVNDPAILLADEPTGALDTRTGDEILELFRTLNAQGRTILVVTHDASVARRCQREIHMQDGRLASSPAARIDAG